MEEASVSMTTAVAGAVVVVFGVEQSFILTVLLQWWRILCWGSVGEELEILVPGRRAWEVEATGDTVTGDGTVNFVPGRRARGLDSNGLCWGSAGEESVEASAPGRGWDVGATGDTVAEDGMVNVVLGGADDVEDVLGRKGMQVEATGGSVTGAGTTAER